MLKDILYSLNFQTYPNVKLNIINGVINSLHIFNINLMY